jgi:hypothetical protein
MACRAKLTRQWVADTLDSGANVTLVEHAFGERPYEFSKDEPGFANVNLLQVRGGPEHELWLQHALYNYGFARLPETASYLSWCDTDIKHVRSDWAIETVHMLQHNRVGQTWTHSVDMDAAGNVMTNEWGNPVDRSFSAAFVDGEIADASGAYVPPRALLPPDKDRDYRSHSGYSWGIQRTALKGIGRLIDWEVIGSGDYHMARAFAGILSKDDFSGMSPSYERKLREFAALCDRYIKRDIGVVAGTVIAGHHGHKSQRFYGTRGDVLAESKFDPDRDIVYDFQGLPSLCSDNLELRDGLRRYNTKRDA